MSESERQDDATLRDESFMSAEDLRAYMQEMRRARSEASLSAAEIARAKLIKKLSQPVDVTPEFVSDVKKNLLSQMRIAAERGETDVLVMRFPNELCTDRGRALNNGEADWPATLTGRPKQAYALWTEHLKSAGYELKAQIIDWPGGMPGDIGFYLSWEAAEEH
ncbi:hypothetical protein [Pseudoxanthobacter sp.]|uniref:hypothetical protein n=1 Tax=Pseudoxanthobacter sp. TaxID=1925742 RepID=UPI002FDF40CC